jgi:hypothetical protein
MLRVQTFWFHGSACQEAVNAAEEALLKESLEDADVEVELPLRAFGTLGQVKATIVICLRS